MKQLFHDAMKFLGFDIVRHLNATDPRRLPPDLSTGERDILKRVAPYTMTSVERQIGLIQAIRYLVKRNIDGCIVECGVWRGGSSMAAALSLMEIGVIDRELFLYDTFEGMTAPTNVDRMTNGTSAQEQLDNDKTKEGVWCVAGIDDVQRNVASTGYPESRIHLIKGPVERTIPTNSPNKQIALLRLDTDWYESTKHELIHLFPLLSEGGVLIIDDYGHWEGARKAVDEYLDKLSEKYYLHRLDYTGRILIKH